ncbi:6-bladed beta-propeller [Algoriphagus sp. C2-6-M1]|uniref:6-bladed beta-propeller n=1 Tax=Algoriphagus persicinus TaxID=3108754 RepID=UPI002B3FC913|nr:6-bladed beta-propeller [Algoriphagus sp. C2-6-M1]MEB2779568.1 6-bladed beta-propeller [Algoriphagus sp. C2-6-M1]
MRNFTMISYSFLLTIGFFGCAEKEPETDLKEEIVAIDLSEAREAKLSEYFQSVNYTLLDYTDEMPIVNGFKMVVTKDEIFVESRETARVFVFDNSGQLKHVIGQFGDGPGEIRLIDGLFVNGDTIRVDAEYANKYVLFSKNGEFIKEGKLSFRAPAIYEDDFNLYYFQHGEGAEQWTFIREDKNVQIPLKSLKGYLPLRNGFEKFLGFNGPNGFIKDLQNGEFFYTEPNDYVVQNFDSLGYFKRTIRFDFGEYNWPLEKRIELAGKGRERNEYVKENQVVSGVHDFYPFRNFYFMSTGTYNYSFWVFMDKNFESMDIIQEWKNDLDGMKLRQLSWTKSNDEIIYQLDSRTFFNDYVEAFNGKTVEPKSGGIHEFFAKNKEKLQEEKIVLVSYKLK